jgi:phage terminase large subunit-like protein
MVPPPTRKIACRLTVTYAGFSGESELLEELYERGLQQPEVAPSLRAGDGILMAWHHGPVAPWQDEAWLAEMRRSLRPNQFLRMIQNEFVTSEASFVTMNAWDRIVNPTIGHMAPNKQAQVFIGVDVSVKHDSTAIVAVARDGTGESRSFRVATHRVFQPSPDQPLDFEQTVERVVLDLDKRYYVCKVLFDPFQMASTAQRLAKQGVPIEEFPQSVPNLTAASQNLFELIQSQQLVAYPDEAMRLAISRAVAVESSRGWKISKDKQTHKIDVVVALAMACHAAVTCTDARPYYNLDALAGVSDDDPDGSKAFHMLRFMDHIRRYG